MVLGVGLANNFGMHPAAWHLPDVDPGAYADIAATVRQVQAAERGDPHFVFLAERLFLHGDPVTEPPLFNMDPLTSLTAVSQTTERVGLIGTASTSFNEPYLLARQLKTMDVVSHGRVGWNAVPSYEPDALANAGSSCRPVNRSTRGSTRPSRWSTGCGGAGAGKPVGPIRAACSQTPPTSGRSTCAASMSAPAVHSPSRPPSRVSRLS